MEGWRESSRYISAYSTIHAQTSPKNGPNPFLDEVSYTI
jgi:hypothetical protein